MWNIDQQVTFWGKIFITLNLVYIINYSTLQPLCKPVFWNILLGVEKLFLQFCILNDKNESFSAPLSKWKKRVENMKDLQYYPTSQNPWAHLWLTPSRLHYITAGDFHVQCYIWVYSQLLTLYMFNGIFQYICNSWLTYSLKVTWL